MLRPAWTDADDRVAVLMCRQFVSADYPDVPASAAGRIGDTDERFVFAVVAVRNTHPNSFGVMVLACKTGAVAAAADDDAARSVAFVVGSDEFRTVIGKAVERAALSDAWTGQYWYDAGVVGVQRK